MLAFDALLGVAEPYAGFGGMLPYTAELETEFRRAVVDARERLHKGFRQCMDIPAEVSKGLDLIVTEMWNTGWDPIKGKVNLFVRDFGLVLTQSILDRFGGMTVFRSKSDLSHLSIFWKNHCLEAFPFHKALKCVLNRDGESMASFAEDLSNRIGNESKNQM